MHVLANETENKSAKSNPLVVTLAWCSWGHSRARWKLHRAKTSICDLQVFATYPNEDYDRRNEDVDPMAASAEYELEKRVERLDLFPVELEKGEDVLQNGALLLFHQLLTPLSHYSIRGLFPASTHLRLAAV